jgi:Tol biopolymer transport system component
VSTVHARRGRARLLAALSLVAAACSGGGQHTHLTPTPASSPVDRELQRLSSSPSESIVFASDRAGRLQIYSMLADGRREVRLTQDAAIDSWPQWSLDKARIAFASTKFGKSDVFVMPAAGGEPVRLTTNRSDDYHPAWSPDGSMLAFESLRDGNAEIYVMRTDGGGQTRLTRNPGLDGSPAWSPDGTRIAFESERHGNEDIYTMRPDGSDLRRSPTSCLRGRWRCRSRPTPRRRCRISSVPATT